MEFSPSATGGLRRTMRALRSILFDRLMGLGSIRDHVTILRRDQNALAMDVQRINERLEQRASVLEQRIGELHDELATARILAARSLIADVSADRPIAEAEFRVFSQWGEDGIIQFLIRHADIRERSFVEFGVEDYREANTRFLLIKDNWRGLVFDSSPTNVEAIRRDPISWRHDLTSRAAFVSAENIDELLTQGGMSGEIGLLSIDIDGNDYWVWKAIRAVRPTIVVIEYNSVFGARKSVSVPYDPAFSRTTAHASNLYFGASLRALVELGKEKGYAFVGCTSAGNDAFFVRRDRMGALRELSVEEGYVASRFRESRDDQGRLTYLSGEARLEAIGAMPLLDLTTGSRITAADLAR